MKIAHIVLTHYNLNDDLVLEESLLDSIEGQLDDCSDFILMVNDRLSANIVTTKDYPQFKEIIFSNKDSVSKVRNDILNYVKKSDYDYVSFIDGDDNITSDYSISLWNNIQYPRNFLVFGGIWKTENSEYDMLSEDNYKNTIKYVNWLYLYQVEFLRKYDIRYPELPNTFAEDELLFTKIRLLCNNEFTLLTERLYIYNHFNSSIAKLDKEESNILTEYLNYDKNYEPNIEKLNSNNSYDS